MGRLAGKIVIVTGAGSSTGIGAAIARLAALEGARLVLADIDVAGATDVAQDIDAKIGDRVAHPIALDLTDEHSIRDMVSAAQQRWGGLHAIVNNAADTSLTGRDGRIETMDVDIWDRTIAANLRGTMLACRHAIPALRASGGGAIVNIASVAATIAFPGIAGYSATKSAVDRLTRVAAFEAGKLGFGVRVNCVYPGLVPTEMGQKLAVDMAELGLFASPEAAVGAVIEQTPAGRLGDVSDMADAVVFLASDQARFITGIGLPVDGGMGM